MRFLKNCFILQKNSCSFLVVVIKKFRENVYDHKSIILVLNFIENLSLNLLEYDAEDPGIYEGSEPK